MFKYSDRNYSNKYLPSMCPKSIRNSYTQSVSLSHSWKENELLLSKVHHQFQKPPYLL